MEGEGGLPTQMLGWCGQGKAKSPWKLRLAFFEEFDRNLSDHRLAFCFWEVRGSVCGSGVLKKIKG